MNRAQYRIKSFISVVLRLYAFYKEEDVPTPYCYAVQYSDTDRGQVSRIPIMMAG